MLTWPNVLKVTTLFNIILSLCLHSEIKGQAYFFQPETESIERLNQLYQNSGDKLQNATLKLYFPDGKFDHFIVRKNELLSDEMLSKYKDIITFEGHSISYSQRQCSITLYGDEIRVMILGYNEKVVMIQFNPDTQSYSSYYPDNEGIYNCYLNEKLKFKYSKGSLRTSTNGSQLKSYSFAVVITDEYELANGGDGSVQAINTATATLNEMNLIFKRDVAVSFVVTIRPETSTYNIVPSGPNAGNGARSVSKYFTIGEYDHGMVFHNAGGSGGGGVAGLGVVCNDTDAVPDAGVQPAKALGWSEGNPSTSYTFMSTVAHEVAHQFGAEHTFNSNHSLYCGPQINAATSFEPGSGSTLMAYPGVCSDNNLTIGDNLTDSGGNILFSSLPYFHVRSLEQMVSFISGSGNACATTSTTGNTPPVTNGNPCSASSPITIPASTPFQLTASSTDVDNDIITYTWEQYNAGPPHGGPAVNCGGTAGPIFRSYAPTTNPTRYFPSLNYILNNNNAPLSSVGECLPTAARTLNFKVTARDNNQAGGGIDVSSIQLSVNNSVGPLVVSNPNTLVSWAAGSTQTITWSGSNTSSLCNEVNILLSIDGGYNYPYTLISSTPNDGSQSVTIPSYVVASTNARIKVESACHLCVKFFDVSNVNFTITGLCATPFSYVCSDAPLSTNPGSPSLNLGLTQSYGNPFTSKTLTTSGSVVNVPYNVSPAASGPTTICNFANFNFYNAYQRFKVTASGSYTFSCSNFLVLAVYSGVYNPASPCSNIIGTTLFYNGSGYSYSNGMTLNLTSACGEYTMVLYGSNSTSQSINISGPSGTVIYENMTPSSSYSYTFAAVNTATGIVAAISATSDFTTLAAGNYCVYGISYYSGSSNPPGNVDPLTFVGQTFNQLQTAGKCFVASSNCKPLTIICNETVVTASGDSGPGTLRNVYNCISEGGTITFQSGVNSNLTAPLIINKSITLQGNTNTVIDLNFGGAYGVNVQNNKSLTLKDIIVNMSGTASPVVLNDGNFILQTSTVSGIVSPVVINNGSISVNGSGISTVKKQ